jgi:hypothetical protein
VHIGSGSRVKYKTETILRWENLEQNVRDISSVTFDLVVKRPSQSEDLPRLWNDKVLHQNSMNSKRTLTLIRELHKYLHAYHANDEMPLIHKRK